MATPFVQGRLRGAHLSVTIETECACCGRPMDIEVDSDMKVRVHEQKAQPLVFLPQVDWTAFSEPNIIHAY